MNGQNPNSRPEFPTTHWSFIYRAGQDSERHAALSELLERYLPALRAFLLSTRRIPAQEVDDILQGFIADKVIQNRLISHAREFRGRFRTFLLSVLDNHLHNLHRHNSAQRRSPGHPLGDIAEISPPDPKTLPPDRQFDVAWGRAVVQQAIERMRQECEQGKRQDLWQVFGDRVLAPLNENTQAVPYEELVQKYGYRTPGEAYNALITAKRMFLRNLRLIVGEYAADDTEIDEEIRELRAILAGARA